MGTRRVRLCPFLSLCRSPTAVPLGAMVMPPSSHHRSGQHRIRCGVERGVAGYRGALVHVAVGRAAWPRPRRRSNRQAGEPAGEGLVARRGGRTKRRRTDDPGDV
eukprot:239523-Prymnesium_polylepis.1